ncbi:hypothetical protein A8U91_02517 [Halomonas elongata]|uniref:Uncharacterized protein n=2 Tax=Halomonas elongata TaxID=2746 RepID=A0A1B8P7C3_HALEL|nr:hypothetical protein A8U91_02517 [Halomonas elongata]
MSSLDSTSNTALGGAPLGKAGLLKFLVPSLIGIGMFLVPFSTGDTINIGMGLLADGLKALLGDALPAIAVVVLCASALLTLIVKFTRPGWARGNALGELFDVAPLWLVMRLLGAAFALMTFFQVGPEVITASFTGG